MWKKTRLPMRWFLLIQKDQGSRIFPCISHPLKLTEANKAHEPEIIKVHVHIPHSCNPRRDPSRQARMSEFTERVCVAELDHNKPKAGRWRVGLGTVFGAIGMMMMMCLLLKVCAGLRRWWGFAPNRAC